MIHFFARVTICFLVCAAVFAPPYSAAQERLTILATTSIIEDTVRNIAGDDADVSALMGEGVDPHLYKASPGDVRRLSQADLIFHNGLHLEGKMADVLEKLSERKPVVAVTEKIPRQRLLQPKEFEGHFDPHVWFEVALWALAAERVRDALVERDPARAAAYRGRFDRYKQELDSLSTWVANEMAAIPKDRRVLVTAHDAFGYFGRAYDIEVLAIQGVSTDSEASLQDINHLVNLLVSRRIPAVFIESSVSQKAVQALVEGCVAQNHPVRIGGELHSDALGKAGTPAGTYTGMVRRNVETIRDALAGRAQ